MSLFTENVQWFRYRGQFEWGDTSWEYCFSDSRETAQRVAEKRYERHFHSGKFKGTSVESIEKPPAYWLTKRLQILEQKRKEINFESESLKNLMREI